MKILGQEVIFSACFYEREAFRCRRHLDIRLEGCGERQDLTVVMLNPGSAAQRNAGLQNSPLIIPPDVQVYGDPTLYRVAGLMRENSRLKWIRVLNLSDIINPHSHKFYDELGKLKDNTFPHSIFDPARFEELESVIKPGDPIYLAWGTSNKTNDLKASAIVALRSLNSILLNPPTTGFGAFHPLVRPPAHFWKQTATLSIADFFHS